MAEVAGAWAAQLTWDSVPEPVKEATRRAFLQSVAGGVAGHGLPETEVALNTARAEAEAGPCTIFIDGAKAPAATAIFVNSVMFCALEQQEMHVESGTHPLEVIVPVALNLAQLRPTSGVALLEAVVVGAEVTIGFGRAAMDATRHGGADGLQSTFGPAVYGAVGAAATAAKMLGLGSHATSVALCQVAGLASGLSECLKSGATDYHYVLGEASRAGYAAARLAAAGAEATPTIFEGPAGFFHRFADIPADELDQRALTAALRDRLGRQWGMPEHIYKPYPVHFPNLPYIDAAKVLRQRHSIDPSAIESIELTLNDWCELSRGGNLGPYRQREDTRAATAYAVAGMLARGHYSVHDVDKFDAPDILELVSKSRIEHFTDSGAANDWTSVRLRVQTKSQTHTYDSVSEGIPDYRLPLAELRRLGSEALSLVVRPERVSRIMAELDHIDEVSEVTDLLRMLGSEQDAAQVGTGEGLAKS